MDHPKDASRWEQLETRLLLLALVGMLGVSLANEVFDFASNPKFYFPMILLALLVIVRIADVTRDRIESIAIGTPLRTYDSQAEFYGGALPAINTAETNLLAVFTHTTSPLQHTIESRRYYAGTLRWVKKNPGKRSLHRVIRLPATSPDVQEWVDEQIRLANKIENYHVRVLRYPPGLELEGENFVVIDSREIFLGFEIAGREELRGFSIHDEKVARSFEQHFWELWRIADHNSQGIFTANLAHQTPQSA